MSKVLLIGAGGREHALAWKLCGSPQVERLYLSPGSEALKAYGTCVYLNAAVDVLDFVESERIDLTVFGPEVPLVAGWSDALLARGHLVCGPSKAAARLEGSKRFAKDFMRRHRIPTADYVVHDNPTSALKDIKARRRPFVVKTDGLAAGKGVTLCRDWPEGDAAIRAAMIERRFGEAGRCVLIEERLEGEEFSLFVLCDGQDYRLLPPTQDHKPLLDGNRGPNTGGMGAYCPAERLSPAVTAQIEREIIIPTLQGMASEGHPYRGVLYLGLMIEKGQPYVLEYNCRFGDPECQPLMMLLAPASSDEVSLAAVLTALAREELAQLPPLAWREGAAACVALASPGYPGRFRKGLVIAGLEDFAPSDDLRIFHAGAGRDAENRWITTGGRVLGVTAWGADLPTALARCYDQVERIHWYGIQYRRDIGRLPQHSEARP